MPRNPYYDPSRSHHRPWGFGNPPGSPKGPHLGQASLSEAIHFARQMWRLRGEPAGLGETHRLPEEEVLKGLAPLSSPRRVTWLGHAAFLINLQGKRVLTDPFLSEYAAPVPTPGTRRLYPPALPVEKLPRIDLILISHNHYDHLDAPTLKRLASRFPYTPVVVPLGLRKLLLKLGFHQVKELDWYDHVHTEELTVTALPAIHMSRRGLRDQNATLWCGFAIRDAQWQGYFAGDTAYGPVFDEVGERLGPFDVGLVPIGAYEPRSLMKSVHATPEDAVAIGEAIGARRLIGMHWGTLRLTTEPMHEPPRRFAAVPTEIDCEVLPIGMTVSV
ncbi:MBL fold metallo-hydrolase [Marinobacteraceae bacterium S3BR75-40.1]